MKDLMLCHLFSEQGTEWKDLLDGREGGGGEPEMKIEVLECSFCDPDEDRIVLKHDYLLRFLPSRYPTLA
jgi:hypothetical protein